VEILRQASFGFTHDRLLHIQGEDVKAWTDACTGELRRQIASAAPSHIKVTLIEFRQLRCLSLQCLPLRMHADEASAADGLGPASAPPMAENAVAAAGTAASEVATRSSRTMWAASIASAAAAGARVRGGGLESTASGDAPGGATP
jgi:hypothetical protein